ESSATLACGDGDVGGKQLLDAVKALAELIHRRRVRDPHVLGRAEAAPGNNSDPGFVQNRQAEVVTCFNLAPCNRLAKQLRDIRKHVERARWDDFKFETWDRAHALH